jgi:hypothetical protein
MESRTIAQHVTYTRYARQATKRVVSLWTKEQSMMTNLEQYVKERDKALLSFDIEKVKKLCRKWEIVMPDNDVVLYAGMMKAICDLKKATPEEKARAQEWLTKNKFKVGIQ